MAAEYIPPELQALEVLFVRTFPPEEVVEADNGSRGGLTPANLERGHRHGKDLYGSPAIAQQAVEFMAETGGQVYFCPDEAEMESLTGPWFTVRASDICYPVCQVGLNRSQVMFLILSAIKRRLCGHVEGVKPPHGAEHGYDPFQAYADLDESNYFGYLTHHGLEPHADEQHMAFFKTFGQTRQRRFASDMAKEKFLNPTPDTHDFRVVERDRRLLRHYFDTTYFAVTKTEHPPRRVFFCFMRAAGIIMARLLETKRAGRDIGNVVILAIPHGDPISQAATLDNIAATRAAGDKTASAESLTNTAYVQLFQRLAALVAGVQPGGVAAAGGGGGAPSTSAMPVAASALPFPSEKPLASAAPPHVAAPAPHHHQHHGHTHHHDNPDALGVATPATGASASGTAHTVTGADGGPSMPPPVVSTPRSAVKFPTL